MIVVNDMLRVAYTPIPKVASSSIRGVVQGRHVEHVPDGYFSFAFIRHPWDRLVSALYCNLRSFDPLDERLAQFITDKHIDSHVRPQVTFLYGHRVDFIGRFDRLHADWGALREHVPLDWPQQFNVGKHRPMDWRSAPVDWSRWLSLYQPDFDLCPDWQH